MSIKSLANRIAALETERTEGELPNGGLLLVFRREGESDQAAVQRTVEASGFSRGHLAHMIPVYLHEFDKDT